ncbi:hypothetical protein FH972_007563 [Carpinus fangiana]|uniref:Glycosyl transferase family 1 domain-containing protein n=1 Tax=Carpinus fangiana TaxID=176857 RepID=A0A5N6QVW1_9ROSI|nr:hypothetical protein FH972_007563 [Carpinus fangiana]
MACTTKSEWTKMALANKSGFVPWHVPCGGICYGDGNLAFIANDWHTALLPVYLKAYYRDNDIQIVVYLNQGLIHFISETLETEAVEQLKGRGPVADFAYVDLPAHYLDLFKFYDPVRGEHFNIFAAGLKTTNRVVTVSHGYSWELKTPEGGWGLHGIINENDWKFRGIVNGIDTKDWNPQCDVNLTSYGYTNYSLETLKTGKPQCKAALQKELGLPIREDVLVIGFIGRLDHQKGVDLIAEAIPWMMDQDVRLIMLGIGRLDLEQMLRQFENHHHDKIKGWVGFSVKMAHRITAVPVVHAVGGLRDTVHPFDPFNESGLGWTFDSADANKLIHALGNCLLTYREYKQSWEGLQRRWMMQDLSWDNAAQNYEEVLVAAKYQWAILRHLDEWGNPRVSILSNDTLELSGDVDLFQLFQHQVGEVQVFGACNGIICLAATLWKDGKMIWGYEQLVLWNPATRESKMLPPIHRPSDLPDHFSHIGFGFDSKTNDYKVVRILHYKSQYEVAVYSLSADSWRVIDSSPNPSCSIHSSRYPSYVNGVDHWWVFDTGKGYRLFLLSFDMSNEVFKKVLLPPIEASLIEDFAVINDSLALILRCEDELYYSFDIWVLNESVVERTWAKLLTIGRIPPCLWTLIQLREDGSVVLSDSNMEGLKLYDPRTQEVRDLRINGTVYCSELVSYTESIVFLNGWWDLLGHQESS